MENKKYEFMAEQTMGSNSLRRIRALRNFGDVKKGDLGGWIEKEENLSREGECWVYENSEVSGDAKVYGYAKITGDSIVSGFANIHGNTIISGNSIIEGGAEICGNSRIMSGEVYGSASIKDMIIGKGAKIACPDDVSTLTLENCRQIYFYRAEDGIRTVSEYGNSISLKKLKKRMKKDSKALYKAHKGAIEKVQKSMNKWKSNFDLDEIEEDASISEDEVFDTLKKLNEDRVKFAVNLEKRVFNANTEKSENGAGEKYTFTREELKNLYRAYHRNFKRYEKFRVSSPTNSIDTSNCPKKYIITNETMYYKGHALHRIKAIRNFYGVKEGELGGWIEKEENLSHEGDCWIYDNGKVFDGAKVCDNASIFNNSEVFGYASVAEYATLTGNSSVSHASRLAGHCRVDDSTISGFLVIGDYGRVIESHVSGNVDIRGTSKIVNGVIERNTDYLNISSFNIDAALSITFFKNNQLHIMVCMGDTFYGELENFKVKYPTYEKAIEFAESVLYGK